MLHVVLDAGSGCNVKFHRSPIWSDMTQLFEWKFTRQLTDLIYRKLAKEKIVIHKLVKDKYYLTTFEKLRRIENLVNKYGAENCLIISIQMNYGKGSGWSIYVNQAKNPIGVLYANIYDKIYDKKYTSMKMMKLKNNGVIDRDLTLLKRVKCAAMVTNNFFINRKHECKRLMTLEGIRAVRDYHVEAIKKCIDYHKENKQEIINILNKSNNE